MYLRAVRRRTLVMTVLIIVADAVLLAVALGLLFTGSSSVPTPTPTPSPMAPSRHSGLSLPAKPTRHAANRGSTAVSTVAPSSYHPLRVVPPQTAVQQTIDESMAQESAQASNLLKGSAWTAPATSAPFRAIDAADSASPSLFAMAFTQKLLDIRFASSTRNQLLAWADDNAAPFSLGTVPASLATRVLGVSLITGHSPVPSMTTWAELATSRTSWSVSGLVVSVNPTWTQALSAGWVPRDPLMGIYDVSGVLSVSSPGHATVVTSISFALTLGGAALHPGYGAVALDNWTLD